MANFAGMSSGSGGSTSGGSSGVDLTQLLNVNTGTGGVDLNALLSSVGGSSSTGGGSSVGGGWLASKAAEAAAASGAPATGNNLTGTTTTESSKEGTSTTNKKTKGKTNTTKTGSSVGAKAGEQQMQTVTDPVINLLNAIAGNIQTNPVLAAIDQARQQNITSAQQALANFDANEIIAGAEGNVQALQRQLMEEVLPQIMGATEAGGTYGNAMSGILGNDAVARTSEAAARVMETARANAATQQQALLDRVNQAVQGGSAGVDAINNLISGARGVINSGTTAESAVENVSEQGQTTASETSNLTGTTNETGTINGINLTDLAALLNAQSNLNANSNQLSPYDLAALQMSLKSPFDATGYNLNGTSLQPSTFGYQSPFNSRITR